MDASRQNGIAVALPQRESIAFDLTNKYVTMDITQGDETKRINDMPTDEPANQSIFWRKRFATAFAPRVIRKAIIAAMLVGSVLILLNQGDLLFSGQITGGVIIKCLITPLIPFCVTMLGAVLNSGSATRPEDLRPGPAAIRRSLIIAVIVGSVIILVNQGDLIMTGNVSPRTLLKIAITPIVPFCVSLYGAYLAYRNALASQLTA